MPELTAADRMAYEEHRIDKQLANLLQGDHPIEGDHEVRVIRLEELIILHRATDEAGWARHTGDWDWFVTITHEGKEYPDIEDGMGLSFDFADRPENFTACVNHDKVTHITLDYDPFDDSTDNEHTVQLDINHITNVRWEQA